MANHLADLGFGNILGIHASQADALIMDLQHHPGGPFSIHGEKALQDLDEAGKEGDGDEGEGEEVELADIALRDDMVDELAQDEGGNELQERDGDDGDEDDENHPPIGTGVVGDAAQQRLVYLGFAFGWVVADDAPPSTTAVGHTFLSVARACGPGDVSGSGRSAGAGGIPRP